MARTLADTKMHKRRHKHPARADHAVTQRTGDTTVASRVGIQRYRQRRIPEADWRAATPWWGS
jgi:hypothetical protein